MTMAAPLVVFIVTHLLGVGHLQRVVALARKLGRSGVGSIVVNGGVAVPTLTEGVNCVQLPPLRSADLSFSRLVDEEGGAPNAAYYAARRDRLLRVIVEAAPNLIVTEHYPFGRRKLADEYDAAIDAARRRNPELLVWSSVRDILVDPLDSTKRARVEAVLVRDYDVVLVHGDPAIIRLEESFSLSAAALDRVRYTGYLDIAGDGVEVTEVVSDFPEIIVAAGGGMAGLALFRAILAAWSLMREGRGKRFRFLVGWTVSEADFLSIHILADRVAGDFIRVERARSDYRQLLRGALASISQAGYNTVMDLMAVDCPALVVPFDAAGETEQMVRAERFKRLGLLSILRFDAACDPAQFAVAIDDLISTRRRDALGIAVRRDGLENSSAQLMLACGV